MMKSARFVWGRSSRRFCQRTIAFTVALLSLPIMAIAAEPVTIEVETDKPEYYRNSLGTTPIVVTLSITNEGDQYVRFSGAWNTGDSMHDRFGELRIVPLSGQSITLPTSPRKWLEFFPNRSQAIMSNVWPIYLGDPGTMARQVLSGTVYVTGGQLPPHSRVTVCRVEIYGSDFSPNPPPAGQYEINMWMYPYTIGLTNSTDLPGFTGSFSHVTRALIKLK